MRQLATEVAPVSTDRRASPAKQAPSPAAAWEQPQLDGAASARSALAVAAAGDDWEAPAVDFSVAAVAAVPGSSPFDDSAAAPADDEEEEVGGGGVAVAHAPARATLLLTKLSKQKQRLARAGVHFNAEGAPQRFRASAAGGVSPSRAAPSFAPASGRGLAQSGAAMVGTATAAGFMMRPVGGQGSGGGGGLGSAMAQLDARAGAPLSLSSAALSFS